MTSTQTAEQIVFILVDEVDTDKTEAIISRLEKVQGNKSFCDTVVLARQIFESQVTIGGAE